MSYIVETDKEYVAGTYNRFPVEIVRGGGSVVWDADGKRYIDMGSGIGVTALGLANEGWQNAVAAQLGQLQHMSNLYYTAPCAKLAKLLCERTGMKKVFFGNSGAEANECAIKVARKYAADKKGADYTTIITLGSQQTKVPSPKLVNFVLTCGTIGTMLTFVVTGPIVEHSGPQAALLTANGLYAVVFVMCFLLGFVSRHRQHNTLTSH